MSTLCRSQLDRGLHRFLRVFGVSLFFAAISLAQAATDTFNASGTWTAPAGVTSVTVEAWGGGGAGGGQNQNSDGGGGGGGGAYSKAVITVTPGNTYTVTIGAGGAGVAGGTGGSGGDSYFIDTATVLAKGGTGGAPSTGTPPAGGMGGAATSGVGTTKFSGGNGGRGRNSNTGRGGPGGSSAGTAANGTSGPATWSTLTAAAAPAGGGIGGNGGDENGTDGFAPTSGSGGGGGGSGEGTSRIGGDGAAGKVVISYVGAPPPIAIYTLDDQTWNDSSGNGYNGAVGGVGGTAPIFSSVSPAVGTTTGTCGYRSFSRPDKTYIYLPSSFPNMGADGNAFTNTAWIRTTDNTQPGQRILIDDESNSGGYGFSLGDGGTGMLRFYTRGTPSALILDTSNVIANNTWYFVAAVADVPNKNKYIYVFNTAGGLVTSVNATWTEASFGSDSGVASMGGETNASGENTGTFGFAGNLDEVRVYPNALSQADLATVQAITRPCPGNVVTPGAFNACEVTSPKCVPTALPDVSYAVLTNKTVGQSFNLDAVALLSGGTLQNTFSGNVQVDLLANTSSGVALGSNNCPVSQTATIALGSKTFASGRASISAITINSVYSDVRVRYTCTAAVCGTAVTACSTGSFAVVAAGPDHYELSLPSSSVSCLASTATVTACANNSSPCTSTYAGANGSTATLATTGATLGASTVTFNAAGVATTTLSYPSAANGTAVSVTLSGVTGANSNQCCPDGVSCVVANSCSSTFNTSGFVFSASAGGAVATIPSQVAGITSSPYYLRAVKTNTTTQACVSALSAGASSVTMGYNCNNPSSCSTGNYLDITPYNGATAQTTQTVAAGGTALSLYFDANGNAPLTFDYRDVGQITPTANMAASGSLLSALSGTSNAFVVAPHHFGFSAITAAPIKAGNNFSATVTAYNGLSTPTATMNFGKETSAEGVTLSSTRYQPTGAGAVNGSFSGNLGAFNNGVATGTNLNWSEVGTMDLTATLTSGSYLGSTLTATGATGSTGAVGRFIPDHFDVAVTQGCNAVTAFTYSAQPFTVKVTARNGLATPTTTLNYDGSANTSPNFSKAVTLSELNGVVGSLSPSSVAASAFTAGVANATPAFTFTAVPTAPGTIKLRAVDTDNVSSQNWAEGTALIRSGRLMMQNAYGSELLALPVPLQAQYWNAGGYYVTNTDDSCTVLPISSITMGNYLNQLSACKTQLTPVGNVTLSAGGLPGAGLALTAPGKDNSGSVDLAVNVGATATGNTCVGATQSAATAANMPWFAPNPGARATFGLYKSRLIYRRENY